MSGTLLRAFQITFAPTKFDVQYKIIEQRQTGPIQQDAVLQRILFNTREWPCTSREVDSKIDVDIAFDQSTPAVGGWLLFKTIVDIANRVDWILGKVAKDIFRIDL